jgi:hypothetical protein
LRSLSSLPSLTPVALAQIFAAMIWVGHPWEKLQDEPLKAFFACHKASNGQFRPLSPANCAPSDAVHMREASRGWGGHLRSRPLSECIWFSPCFRLFRRSRLHEFCTDTASSKKNLIGFQPESDTNT